MLVQHDGVCNGWDRQVNSHCSGSRREESPHTEKWLAAAAADRWQHPPDWLHFWTVNTMLQAHYCMSSSGHRNQATNTVHIMAEQGMGHKSSLFDTKRRLALFDIKRRLSLFDIEEKLPINEIEQKWSYINIMTDTEYRIFFKYKLKAITLTYSEQRPLNNADWTNQSMTSHKCNQMQSLLVELQWQLTAFVQRANRTHWHWLELTT